MNVTQGRQDPGIFYDEKDKGQICFISTSTRHLRDSESPDGSDPHGIVYSYDNTVRLYGTIFYRSVRTEEPMDYRCAEEKEVGELRGDIGAIR
jgi:hypothetical protein